VKLSSGTESSHVEEDEDGEGEGEAGRGEARGPVVDAEFLKAEHGAPVEEGRLLKPRHAVKDGGDVVVAIEHFARDLGVARLIGADQAELIAAEVWGEAVGEEIDGKGQQNDGFPDEFAFGDAEPSSPTGTSCGRVQVVWGRGHDASVRLTE